MYNLLFLDIETMSNPYMLDYLDQPQAPSNYKDPEKIQSYIDNQMEKNIEKMSLDIDFSLIRAISVSEGMDDKDFVYLCNGNPHTEEQSLRIFWTFFEHNPNLRVVGYNIRGFDLPIILRRSWVYGIKPVIHFDLTSRYFSGIIDLMQILYHGGYAPGVKYRGLKEVCKMYGIKNELEGVDGSMVDEMDDEQLVTYAKNDLTLIKDLAKRTYEFYWT